jgi:hypothetical protein
MNKITCCIIAILVSATTIAQQNNIHGRTIFQPLPQYSFINTTNIYSLKKPVTCSIFNAPVHIQYSLPKGAIFCRMEDALHQHFNLWIKVRMGDNDYYSN